MKTSFMRFRVVFAMFSALFFIGAFLFPQYVQAVDVSNWNELKNAIAPDEGEGPSGELTINILNNFSLEGNITIPKDSALTNLTINGNGHTIDGDEKFEFLAIMKNGKELTNGFEFVLNNIQINNCKSKAGAVIFVPQENNSEAMEKINIMITDSAFSGNEISRDEQGFNGGGVIHHSSDNSSLIISNCNFTKNKASSEVEDNDGGVIYQQSYKDKIIINNSTFTDNEASNGGAIYLNTSPEEDISNLLIIGNSTFSNNSALSQGGAIRLGGLVELTVNNSLFKLNTAGETGGAIKQMSDGKMTVTDCQFLENSSVEGGAIETHSEVILIGSDNSEPEEGCWFEKNNAQGNEIDYGWGGAISYYDTKITIEKCSFKNNSADYCGALYSLYQGDATIKNSFFVGNHAAVAGVICNMENKNLIVNDSTFTENYADSNEAIVFLQNVDSASFKNNTFTGNTVKDENGWVFTLRGTNTISNNEFHANTDTERDMLFSDPYEDDPADTVSGNIYRGNYLEDKFSSPESGDEITYSEDIEVKLELREVYNNEVLDGNVKITINGTPYPETFAVEKGTAHLKIKRSALKDGTNEITAEYVSDECVSDECKQSGYVIGYYHYQQPEKLTFTIRKTTVIYTVTVIDDGNGTASAEPASGEEGDTVTLTAKPKEGYKFKEWQVEGDGSLDGNIFTIGAGNAVIKAVFEKSEGPQPPVPPRPEPDWPHFFRLNDELPKTGINGTGIVTAEKPASVNYKPVNMELQIPGLNVFSEIVTVPVTDEGYAVAWLGNDAGLLEGSALPGEGISVIAGHNTLNAEEFGPFAAIRQMDEGERFFVMNTKGKLMTFEVYANEKIGSHDTEALRKAALVYDNTLTLLTCEDELPEGGYASRRIVSAKYIN